jgi:hypothetical protein
VLDRDGVPMASLVAGEVTFFSEPDPTTEWQARQVLLRGVAGSIACSGNRRAGAGRMAAYALERVALGEGKS